MAKQIRANELFEKEDIFEGIRKSAEKTMVTLEKVDVEFKQLGKTLKESIGKASFGGSKELKEFLQLVDKANNLQTQTIKLEKEKTIAEQQNEKLKREKIKTQSVENRETERLNKQKQKAIKLAKDESSAYKKLVKATRDLKNQSKELGSQMLLLEQSGKKNTAQYRKLSDQYKKVTKSAQQGDVALKKLDKSVGDNFRNVGNYTGALNKLRGGLASLGLAFGASQIARNIGGIIVGFDQAQADLGAISGKTKDELAGLTDQARKLGKISQFSATQITEMQIELAKLGFTTQQITASTGAISNFAAATGADIPSAAKLAGSALRGFGLEADEMERVVSVLGVSTTKSALSFESLNTGLSTIAPVANAFGFSIEDATALLGQLANAGFDASSAATATRNILLNLADSGGDLAKQLGRPIKSADDLADGLKELQEKGIDLATALELTDKRSVAAFETFLKGSDTLVSFRDSITDVNDELQDMADKRLESIQGQLTLLSSAWSEFVLNTAEAIGTSERFKTVIKFLTKNLDQIMNVLGKVIRAFLLYKTTMIALKGVQFLFNGGLKTTLINMSKQIPMTRAYRLEQIKLARATKESGKATKGLGKSLGAVPWMIIIGLVIELVSLYLEWGTATGRLAKQQERLNIASEQGKKIEQDKIDASKTILEQKAKALNLAKREEKIGKSEAEQDKIEIERLDKLNELYTEYVDKLTLSKRARQKALINLDFELSKVDTRIKIGNKTNGQAVKTISALNVKREKETSAIKTINSELKNAKDILAEYTIQQKEATTIDPITEDDKPKKQKEFNTQLKQTNDYLSRQLELIQQLTRIRQDRELMTRQEGIESEFDMQLETLGKTGEFDATKLNEMINAKTELEQEYIDQRTIYELDALQKKYIDIEKKERNALANQRTKLLSQKDISESAKLKIEADYIIKSDELVVEQKERQDDRAREEVIIVEKSENEKLEIRKNGFETLDEYNQEFLDKEKEYNEKIKELDAERIKKREESTREFVKATADYFIKKSNEKIAQIDKEIQASEKQYDTLKKLAEEGNIDAKESLAEQQKIIAEANRRKEQEQKRQQRIQLAESVYSTYSSKVEAGSKNPLAETIRDTALLQQFISSLPTFEDGTDNTGTNGRGIDGKGGFLSVLHPNERVVPKSLNEQIGGLTNEQLGQIAMEYNNGKIVNSNSQVGSALELSLLVNKLDNLTKVIQDKPETNIELGEITQGAMEIVKSTRKGNTYTYNRYKVK